MLRPPPVGRPKNPMISGFNPKREPLVIVQKADGTKQSMTFKELKELGLVENSKRQSLISRLIDLFGKFLIKLVKN